MEGTGRGVDGLKLEMWGWWVQEYTGECKEAVGKMKILVAHWLGKIMSATGWTPPLEHTALQKDRNVHVLVHMNIWHTFDVHMINTKKRTQTKLSFVNPGKRLKDEQSKGESNKNLKHLENIYATHKKIDPCLNLLNTFVWPGVHGWFFLHLLLQPIDCVYTKKYLCHTLKHLVSSVSRCSIVKHWITSFPPNNRLKMNMWVVKGQILHRTIYFNIFSILQAMTPNHWILVLCFSIQLVFFPPSISFFLLFVCTVFLKWAAAERCPLKDYTWFCWHGNGETSRVGMEKDSGAEKWQVHTHMVVLIVDCCFPIQE